MSDKKKHHHHQDIQSNHSTNDPASREAAHVDPIVPKTTAPVQKKSHKQEHRENNFDVHGYEIPKPYDSMHSRESKQTHNYENRKNSDHEK